MKSALVLVTAALFAVAVVAGQGRSAADLYQDALHLQDVKGDLQAAIALYKTIVERHAKDRPLVAKALFQLGSCYEKLGHAEARRAYERIVQEYADVPDVAARAREQLSAIRAADEAPFKVRTLDPVIDTASPDGRYQIYRAGATAVVNVTDPRRPAGRIMLRDARMGVERVLLDLDGVVSNFAWSPDGRQLAFHFQNTQQKLREMRIVRIETGEMRTLPVGDYPSRWSTAGELYVTRPNPSAYQLEILRMPAAGGELQKVLSWSMAGETPMGRPFAAPPDVSFIVGAKSKRLLRIDPVTGEERRITTGSADEGFPVVSHDGRLVAFASNPDGRWGLYVAPLDAIPVANPVRIAAIDPQALSGSRLMRQDWWLPNGTLSIVLDRAESAIYRVNVDRTTGLATAPPVRLTRDGSWSGWGSVSPDGRQIAYWYRDARVARYGAAVMDSDGRNERPLFELDAGFQLWWRGSDEILFTNFAGTAGQKPEVVGFDVRNLTRKPLAQVTSMQWSYVPARRSILHAPSSPRQATVLKERSLADGTDRDVATLDFLWRPALASPNGAHIAYSVAAKSDVIDPPCEVSLMTFDGRRERVLVPMQQPCAYPTSWSPDGRFLLLDGARGPRVLNVETADSWQVHTDAAPDPSRAQGGWSASSWSPDGSFILLTRAERRIERLGWDGVTYEAITRLMKKRGT